MGEPGEKIADPRYMLDFKGITTEISEETMKEAVSSLDFKEAQSRVGTLPQEIEKWAERNMVDISDRGLGGDRWHIGIPFNSPLIALHFMVAGEQQFKEALEKGWLTMHLMTWSRRKEEQANDQGPKEGQMPVSDNDRKRIRQETLDEAHDFIHSLAFKQLGSQGWGYDDELEALAKQIKNLPEKQ